MKTCALLVIMLIGLVSQLSAQAVGDAIQIEYNGSWYDGKILKVNGDQYFITYSGWDESWNEWVCKDRLKGFADAPAASPLTNFKVGDLVEVEYGMIPEPAKVIAVGENKYQIEFENKLFGKKWVTEREMKKL